MLLNTYITFILAILGTLLASYIACVVDRNNLFAFNRSKCNFCKKSLNYKSLIPIISFLYSKGKCIYCKESIPIKYFYLELFCLVIFPVYYFTTLTNNIFITSISILMLSIYVYIFYLDWEKMLINMYALIYLLILKFIIIALENNSLQEVLYNNLLALFIGFLFLYSIDFLYSYKKKIKGMGEGDPYLAGVLGFIFGIKLVFPIIVTGSFMGILYHISKNGINSLNIKKKIPFGSFLILSAIFIHVINNLLFI